MNKTCTKCKTIKNITEFSKDKRQKYGRRPDCKACEFLSSGRVMKKINQRISISPYYTNMQVKITKEDIELLSKNCYFCKQEVGIGSHIHRINKNKGYIQNNITRVHNGCHQKYHNQFKKRNNKGQFVKGVQGLSVA